MVLLVSELVSTSVRHASSSEVDVKVTTPTGPIRVEVTDNGPGFLADDPRGEGIVW